MVERRRLTIPAPVIAACWGGRGNVSFQLALSSAPLGDKAAAGLRLQS